MFDNDDFIEGMGCLGVIVMTVLLVIFCTNVVILYLLLWRLVM